MFIGKPDQEDFEGNSFYGNFYLGLYFDSIGNDYFANTFLSIPAQSRKYSDSDMWFHVPKMLCKERGIELDGGGGTGRTNI